MWDHPTPFDNWTFDRFPSFLHSSRVILLLLWACGHVGIATTLSKHSVMSTALSANVPDMPARHTAIAVRRPNGHVRARDRKNPRFQRQVNKSAIQDVELRPVNVDSRSIVSGE
jgi:hypothetical protein